MRISQLAELTGTTVRTVRYYHAVGLLPVPVERDGWRDYTLEHVARVGRIRWLASAGVPLSGIAELLDAEPSGVVADLENTLSGLEGQIAVLQQQRDHLAALLGAARQGRTLSPMPDQVVAHYERMERQAADERTARAVREERHFAELAWYRGDMPAGAELLFVELGPEATGRQLAAYGRDVSSLSDVEVEQVAAAQVERMLTTLGAQADSVAAGLTHEALDRVYDLYTATAGPGQLRVGEDIRRQLHRVLDERSGR